MSDRFARFVVTSALLLFFVFASSLGAQSVAVPSPDTTQPDAHVTNAVERPFEVPALKKDDFFPKGFARELVTDQKSIWTSPAHIQKSDAKWLVPLAGGTAFLLTQDTKISHSFDNNTSLQNKSLQISNLGTYATWGVPGAFLALGKIKGNDHMVDTGERAFQAAVYSTITMQGLKMLTQRTRPYMGGNGSFLNGGDSFPSGHSMEAWALATVIAQEYPHKRFVKIGMYSFATAVSLSRITSQRHYASDVLVGSSIGYMIGRFVMRNSNQNLEAQ
jgi:hypothetical protein